jgi:methionyl-tRNA synthetase
LKKQFYITTPIYYPDDIPGIQTAYSAIAADCQARFHRQTGQDVLFITGSDEHGQKIQAAAKARRLTPQNFVDQTVKDFKIVWKKLAISYDGFIRTSDDGHIRVVEDVFNKLLKSKHIYLGEYSGWYCHGCETFWPENLIKKGRCPKPDCHHTVEKLEEKSYFFRLSEFSDQILEHIKRNPKFILPAGEKSNIVKQLKDGLQDLCVTRRELIWGIPAPPDPSYTIYVWIDALLAYLSAAGYGAMDFKNNWPADLHIIRQDILPFHAIIWPAFCFALKIPPPNSILALGQTKIGGKELTGSQKGPINLVELIDEYGADVLRYYFLREIPIGADLEFSVPSMVKRMNNDLANGLGNLFSRSISMIEKYCGGVVPPPSPATSLERNLERVTGQVKNEYKRANEKMDTRTALQSLWDLVDNLNRYIDETSPWELHKRGYSDRLNTTLYYLADHLSMLAVLLSPFIPKTSALMWKSLGLPQSPQEMKFDRVNSGHFPPGQKVHLSKPLFPRIEFTEA